MLQKTVFVDVVRIHIMKGGDKNEKTINSINNLFIISYEFC